MLTRFAVKRARHPPAAWIHSAGAKPGALVAVRVGGSFVLPTGYARLVMLAGGVGINPLFCMLLELAAGSGAATGSAGGGAAAASTLQSVDLLYCARTREELLFQEQLQGLAGGALEGRLRVRYVVTREAAGAAAPSREARAALACGLVGGNAATGGAGPTGVLICGPPSFSEDMIRAVEGAGVDSCNIHCEKWW
jgi:hypothetical protein